MAMCISMLAFSGPFPGESLPGKTIGIKIELGKKKLGCTKFGICSITLLLDLDELFSKGPDMAEDRVGYGSAYRSESGKLNIRLKKAYMTAGTTSEFFNGGKFVVEEDFTLSSEISGELGLPAGYTIKEGIYRYTENSDEIILSL